MLYCIGSLSLSDNYLELPSASFGIFECRNKQISKKIYTG